MPRAKSKPVAAKNGKKEKYNRPSWDEYFIEIQKIVATRATCDRGRSGCVIVKDRQILTTGYVGSPKGLPHCDDVGHFYKKTIHDDGTITNHCVRTIHAEQNAICQAAKLGIPLEGATIYVRMEPCSVCAKQIINCGITRVVCEKHYHAAQDTIDIFRQAGVALVVLTNEMETYDNM
ncbi:MAG: cytidine/deoxycytidylate deaminase family protein [bacterium]|nr:cytidine/deoxycytidylate deaminase family protein [bacterium]